MEQSVPHALLLAGLCLGAGAAAGVGYDLLRAIRRRRPGVLLTLAADLTFSLEVFLLLLWLFFGPGAGELRLYMASLGLAGAILYFSTLSPLLLRVLTMILRAIETLLGWLLFPLRFLLLQGEKFFVFTKKLFHSGRMRYKMSHEYFRIYPSDFRHRRKGARNREKAHE